jgi:hypothetical protein
MIIEKIPTITSVKRRIKKILQKFNKTLEVVGGETMERWNDGTSG